MKDFLHNIPEQGLYVSSFPELCKLFDTKPSTGEARMNQLAKFRKEAEILDVKDCPGFENHKRGYVIKRGLNCPRSPICHSKQQKLLKPLLCKAIYNEAVNNSAFGVPANTVEFYFRDLMLECGFINSHFPRYGIEDLDKLERRRLCQFFAETDIKDDQSKVLEIATEQSEIICNEGNNAIRSQLDSLSKQDKLLKYTMIPMRTLHKKDGSTLKRRATKKELERRDKIIEEVLKEDHLDWTAEQYKAKRFRLPLPRRIKLDKKIFSALAEKKLKIYSVYRVKIKDMARLKGYAEDATVSPSDYSEFYLEKRLDNASKEKRGFGEWSGNPQSVYYPKEVFSLLKYWIGRKPI